VTPKPVHGEGRAEGEAPMGYYGGLGAGKGWLCTKFLVAPDELAGILRAHEPGLVITNGRVPASYVCTPLEEYLAAYTAYVDALCGEGPMPRALEMGIHMSMAASLACIAFASCPDARYKLASANEPVIDLSPVDLYYAEGVFSTRRSGHISFAVQMAFPKVVSFSREGHEVLHETSGYPSARLYEELRAAVHAVTSPCRIESPVRVHRTDIRISASVRERVRGAPALARLGLTVV
jgi:hypothetical protein